MLYNNKNLFGSENKIQSKFAHCQTCIEKPATLRCNSCQNIELCYTCDKNHHEGSNISNHEREVIAHSKIVE